MLKVLKEMLSFIKAFYFTACNPSCSAQTVKKVHGSVFSTLLKRYYNKKKKKNISPVSMAYFLPLPSIKRNPCCIPGIWGEHYLKERKTSLQVPNLIFQGEGNTFSILPSSKEFTPQILLLHQNL